MLNVNGDMAVIVTVSPSLTPSKVCQCEFANPHAACIMHLRDCFEGAIVKVPVSLALERCSRMWVTAAVLCVLGRMDLWTHE